MEAFTILVVLLLVAALYFLPSIVAFNRGHPNRWLIFVINLFGGVTVLLWFIGLLWACSAIHKSQRGSNGGESGLNLFANDVKQVKLVNEPNGN